ncbi:UNVERIFIED_CONTAM: hypothetical protein Scaly_3110100 [Sesamum calycinum]|uniref:Reverse transcriptase zinc-binding domain-containing protein n=1 Tax=Sesamum calycinum TaxID=2727403 RepID=A0AAW2JL92_9LAMI
MESLHLLIKSKTQNDDNFQFHWRCKELGIVNLCFADDLLLFCKADIYSVTVLHGILQEFKETAGLHANAQKSQILFSKAAVQVQNQIQLILGFPQGTFPVRYLGVPLITSKLSLADCTPLILKIDARIAGWNQLKLTYAGRTQLIKSVLSSIHQYWCSVFILPKGVIKTIEAKLRNFLWKGGSERGGYKVAWEQVCKPTSHGGLGIRNIQMMNNALMGKYLWQVLTKKQDSIWVSWILKYKLKDGTLWAANDKAGSWTWKKLLKLRPHIIKGIQYRVGTGTDFKLWLDPWHPDGALLHRYPHGPLITGLPVDAPLSTVIIGGTWQWPSEHHIDINGIITNLPDIHNGANDTIIWNSRSGIYSTEAAYTVFSNPSSAVEWAPLFYGPFHTPRHKFILWLSILQRLSTLDKPWCTSTDQGCVLCNGGQPETHNHLFFGCSYTKEILYILGRKIRFHWPYTDWKMGIKWASKRWRGSHLWNAAYRSLLAAVIYYTWKERNNRIFQGTSTSAEGVAKIIIDHMRSRILIEDIRPSIQLFTLYRLWRIAWDQIPR